MSSTLASKKKADLKVVILGSASVGKTTFIHRYIEGRYQETISTIGASFSLKQWKSYNIALWDTAGEERFTGLSSFYCRNAGAAILAYDMTCEDSFHALRARFIPLLEAAEPDCLVIVVGMKNDMVSTQNRSVEQKDVLLLAKDVNQRKLNEIPYFETSSLSGHNVNKVFEYIFETCLPAKTEAARVVRLNEAQEKEKGGSCKC